MCVVQIGELVSQLSDETKAQNKAIPWRIIKDTRNFYVHAYGAIDIPFSFTVKMFKSAHMPTRRIRRV